MVTVTALLSRLGAFKRVYRRHVAAPPRTVPRTRVHYSLDLDAGVVQFLGEGVGGLQQVLARLRVDVGPPRRDLDWNDAETHTLDRSTPHQ